MICSVSCFLGILFPVFEAIRFLFLIKIAQIFALVPIIAVMFTFSFSAAFAADPVSGSTATHAEAMAQAEKEIVDSFNKNIAAAKASLAAEYKETVINANCTIAGSVYAATLDEIAKNFADIVKIAAQQVDKAEAAETNVETLKNAIKAVTKVKPNLAYGGARDIEVAVADLANLTASELVSYVTLAADQPATDLQAYYMVFTWTNALSAMKDYLNGEIAKLDMSLYTNDVANKNDPYKTTWAQLAEKKKADLLDAVADTTINIGMGQTASYTALQAMYKAVLTDGLVAYKTVNTISGETVVVSYKLAGDIKTKEDLANSDATTSAEKAALKALVQQNAATAYKNALATYNQEVSNAKTAAEKKAAQDKLDAAKEKIDAFSANRIVLIDEDYIKTADRVAYREDLGQICLDRQKNYEALEKAAAAYKLQVEKDGSLTYVASIIDENLAKAKPIVFNGDAYDAAKLVDGAKNEASNLAWEKEVAVAALNDEMDDILYAADGSDLYYAPEKAKVEAAYQKMIDKVNAAETSEQLRALNKKVSLAGIDNKEAVNRKVEGYLNTTKFMDAVNNYVDYLNIGIASYADGYREKLAAADKADVAEFLAENNARTNADVAGLFAKAEEYAKAIPTNADKKAEKVAVDELVKALPNVITVADKDAVKAAWEAADKADYMPAKLATAVALLKAAEEKAIDDMIAALPKTITTADKAAVTAIQDAVKAFKNEKMYMPTDKDGNITGKATYGKEKAAKDAFKDLRDAEKAAVEATIAALPADATAAQVKAARDAVDAFVKEYTDASEPYQAIAKIANLDKLTFLEAQVKAQQITAVESLKIKASSKATKGAITVKWTVKGDKAVADGFQVWKSTKAQKGYKKAITTTKTSFKNTKNLKKGVRYFYKVRAYKVVDGVKYYSDWSNKANRYAK